MFKKLRNRFLIMHMSVVSLLIALFFGSILFINYRSLERTTDDHMNVLWRMRTNPESVAFTAARPVGGYEPEDRSMVTITEAGRSLIAAPGGSTRLEMRMRSLPGIYIVTDDQQNIVKVESAYEMDDSFYQSITGAVYAKKAESGKLRADNVAFKYHYEDNKLIFVDVSRESEMMNNMFQSFLMIALPLVGLVFLLSLFLANRMIKPIEISYNRQREFIADASHELKTPLATISTNLEVLAGTGEPEQYKWLGYIRSEVERMSGLTNSLLYLARMDYDASMIITPVNIGQLLTDLWLPLEAVMFEKKIESEIQVVPGMTVSGDAEQLRKLFGILLDNAIRYADKHITLSVEENQNHILVVIMNDGPGIPGSELQKIWERFYRCDQARQYNGGYGLGLPMARAIAERHRGSIVVESVVDKETAFTVKLPLSF